MWPSENPWPVTILFVVIATILFIAWAQTKRGWLLYAMLIPGLLTLGAWYYDSIVITEREQVTLDVQGIVRAFQKGDLQKTLSYISDSEPALKALATSAHHLVKLGDDTRLTDIQVEMKPRDQRSVTVFRVNTTLTSSGTSSYQPTMWEAKWQLEKTGWKMYDINYFDPVKGRRAPVSSDWRRYLERSGGGTR